MKYLIQHFICIICIVSFTVEKRGIDKTYASHGSSLWKRSMKIVGNIPGFHGDEFDDA